jgi:mono/diheme cytochrome c family protein
MKVKLIISITTGLLLQACGEQPASSTQQTPVAEVVATDKVYPRIRDVEQIARGGNIFQQHCAQCHGANAEGAPNWHVAGPDGKYPPPALNGTAHAWHHPLPALKHTIRNGTLVIGGNMPAHADKLSEQDIEDVIAWFQNKWPDELYQAWARNNERVSSK